MQKVIIKRVKMQKLVITNVIALVLSFTAMAQEKKVAVFDPAGSVDNAIKEIVREEISSIIVNTEGYTVLERQLIDKVLEENKFQTGGLVDDSQISEIGKRMGANLVFVTSITPMNGNFYISCKMIDVQTARIEKQKTAQTQKGSNDLISIIQKMVGEMLGQVQSSSENVKTETQTQNKFISMNPNISFSEFKTQLKMDSYENKSLPSMLAENKLALASYKKYRKERNPGWILFTTGTVLAGPVATCVFSFGDTYIRSGYYNEWGYWVNDSYFTNEGFIAGCVLWGVGGAAFITGVGLLIASSSDLKTSYQFYNKGSKSAVTFNVQPLVSPNFQGIGFSLRF